jgi:hypothetical protein
MCRSRGRSSRPIIATEPPPAAQCGAAKPSLAFAAPSVAGNRRLPLTDASPSRRRVASMALIRSPGWRPGGAGGARVRRRRPRRRRRRDIRQPSLAFAAPSVAGNRRLPLTDASPSRRRVASMALIRSPGWRPGGAGGARVRRRRPRRRRRRDVRQPSLAFAAPSPDVRGCNCGIRSLDADCAAPSWLRLSAHAGSQGVGDPSLTRTHEPGLWAVSRETKS